MERTSAAVIYDDTGVPFEVTIRDMESSENLLRFIRRQWTLDDAVQFHLPRCAVVVQRTGHGDRLHYAVRVDLIATGSSVTLYASDHDPYSAVRQAFGHLPLSIRRARQKAVA